MTSADFESQDDFISFGRELELEFASQDDSNDVEDQYDHRGTERRRAFEQLHREGGYLNFKQAQHASSRIRPWTSSVNWEACRNPSEMLHEEILAYVDYISPTERERRTREMVVMMITRTIESRWPDAVVLPFGSFETGLYLPLGDIDLVVSSDSIARVSPANALGWIARALKDRDLAYNVRIIAKAKVPIIKFVTTWGGFNVDISLNQVNGVSAGKIMNNFLKRLPALRPLVFVFKAFLSQRDMNELHPKIRNAEIDPGKNLGILLIELFQYYGDYFHYERTGISLRGGGQLFNKRARGWGIGPAQRNQSILSIEDPQDPSNDVSKGSFNMGKIRTTLSGGHSALTTVMFERNDQAVAKRKNRYVKLRKPDSVVDADAMSILGSILNVSQETINHRLMVAELYDSGKMQQELGIEFVPVTDGQHLDQPGPTTKPPSLLARLGGDETNGGRRSSKRQRSRSRSPPDFAAHDSDDSAWDAADQGARFANGKGDSEDEGGRYSVEAARKRRRKEPAPEEVVWISDDSEDDHAPAEKGLSISGASKRAENGRSKTATSQSDRDNRRREFWRSKGLAVENDDSEASRKDLSVSERIAALQRGSSPGPQNARPGSPSGTPPSVPTAHRLKDKIAHFDALGSAPRPSGSFGLGAPLEHKTTSRELYGNRIPAPRKSGAHSIRDQDVSQLSNSSSASLDRDMFARDSASSNHSGEGAEGNVSPVTEISQASHKTESVNVPSIRRTDSLTEHWVDALQSKPGLALDTPATDTSGIFSPPSPIPEADDAPVPAGPSTPLTSTLIRNLGASSHVPSRQGAETPVSVMVETGSLVDGEQPKLVPDAPGTIPPSPVVTGMQLLGLEDGTRAEGETTPTREDSEAGDAKPISAASLAPPAAADESPNTPLARSVDVGEHVAPVVLGGDQSGTSSSSLGLSTGEDMTQGKGLTTTNILQLDAESTKLAPNSVRPSGPSSVVVEPGSIAPSLRASPTPEQQTGARTPEPPSALTPKQAASELPVPPPGTLPLSAATLRLLELEGGKKSGRSGTETPVSVLVETGSSDGKPRDLEGVEAPIATPAPASPATSYFEEPRPVEVGTDGSELSKASASSLTANPKPDNRTVPAPIKTTTIVTNIRRTKTTSVDQTDSSDMKTPTSNAPSFGMSSVRSPNTIHKSRSRPDLSSASMSSAPPSTNSSQTLSVPNGAVQRRATIGSSSKPERRRVSRVPQMQLLPSGQWGVVDDESDEEDVGGWAKVTVTRSRWS